MSPAMNFPVVPIDEALAAIPPQAVVMIVDDERVIADTLGAIFRASGYTVLTAYDGAEALEKSEGQQVDSADHGRDDAGDGRDRSGAIALRAAMPKCRVLLFSGQAATMDLLKGARLAGHDFDVLSKPVHPKEMLARAAECLAVA